MKYIKVIWDESRGDEFDHWGTSLWFVELDDDNFPVRQIEIYEIGNRLKYCDEHWTDEYGNLGDQFIDADDQWGVKISKEEFEKEWIKPSINRS